MSEVLQKKLQKLIRELGRLIHAEVDEGLSAKKPKAEAKPRAAASPWTSAFVDARWFADAKGFTAKLRAVLPNGKFHGVQISTEVAALLDKAWKVRKEDSAAAWYGLKVTVSPDGSVATELNSDPNCVVDPTWFHS